MNRTDSLVDSSSPKKVVQKSSTPAAGTLLPPTPHTTPPPPLQPNSGKVQHHHHHFHNDVGASLGFASETGQGLRCSIPKCGKLFRKDKLLRQHVKHYHPKVFTNWLRTHRSSKNSSFAAAAAGGSDVSDEDEADSLSPPHLKSHFHPGTSLHVDNNRKRKLTSGSDTSFNRAGGGGPEGGSVRKRLRTEPAAADEGEEPPALVCRTTTTTQLQQQQPQSRSRNDSLLSVAGLSDCSEATQDSVFMPQPHVCQGSRGSCPPTPPTFRLSKRRQAQLRATGQRKSLTASMLNKVSASLVRHSAAPHQGSTPGGGGSSLGTVFEDPMSPGAGPVGSYASGSYPPSEMDTSVTSEHLTTEEVVNCHCKRMEEDGLMIQCDICLCWQHGTCLGIEEEDQVQDDYVCDTCRHPRLGKSGGAQLSVDQDWLNKGLLPTLDTGLPQATAAGPSTASPPTTNPAFRKLSELMADLANLAKVLHSLRVKLNIASQSSNGKVFMWSSQWDAPAPSIYEEIATAATNNAASTSTTAEISTTEVPNSRDQEVSGQALLNNDFTDSSFKTVQPHPEGGSIESVDDSVTDPPDGKTSQDSKASDVTAPVSDSKCSTPVPPPPPKEEESSPLPSGNERQQQPTAVEEQSQQDAVPFRSAAADKQSGQTGTVAADARVPPPAQEGPPHAVNGDVDTVSSPPETNSSNKENEEVNGDDDDVATSKMNGDVDTDKDVDPMEVTDDDVLMPSLSEVQQLMSSLEKQEQLQQLQEFFPHNLVPPRPQADNEEAAAPPPPPIIIPEPKILDKDECRLNLLQHIEAVQTEFENRLEVMEKALAEVDNDNPHLSGGPDGGDLVGHTKVLLSLLLQDLSTSNHLVHSK